MGKTTAAHMLRSMGVPVHDSDAAVHRLLGPDGAAVPLVDRYFKGTRLANMISRKRLGKKVFNDDEALATLENILHPLVRHDADSFIDQANRVGASIVALDIPLLFESGRHHDVDYTIVVTCPENQQRQRVMARKGMNEEIFLAVKARQLPDVDKRKLADFVVQTGLGKAYTRKQLQKILNELDIHAGNCLRHRNNRV